jgi:SAM-dependent methyltransferase
MYHFLCNICNSAAFAQTLERETPSCATCGSTVRFRWIAHALSLEIFGESIPLPKFPSRRKLKGLGMSDPAPIADVLSERFDYQNTYFHREPRFDIMRATGAAKFDFIVASEVFEHVEAPVQTAFDNLARLLKPGGFAVFSSPYEAEGDTMEHFPNLDDWKVVELRSGYVLLNRTADGRIETFDNLAFHGGPGSTLEMRVFSEKDLLANCSAAGFTEIAIAEDYLPYGILWEPWARGFTLKTGVH